MRPLSLTKAVEFYLRKRRQLGFPLKEDGQLLLLEASPKAYRELARAQVLGNGVRAYPAIANGYVFARSKDKLVCLDLREGQ